MTKTCFKCGATRPTSEFYRHPRMADGHLGKCKICTRLDVAANRAGKSKDQKWLARERARCVAKQGAYRLRYKEMYPERVSARTALSNAITRGKIKKPLRCDVCGFKGAARQIQGHHGDYSKPLDVMWLCARCHADQHRKERQWLSREDIDKAVRNGGAPVLRTMTAPGGPPSGRDT